MANAACRLTAGYDVPAEALPARARTGPAIALSASSAAANRQGRTRRRHGAAAQADSVRQLPGRQARALVDHVQAAAIGAVDAEQLAERLVHLLDGRLVGAVHADQLLDQLGALLAEAASPPPGDLWTII